MTRAVLRYIPKGIIEARHIRAIKPRNFKK